MNLKRNINWMGFYEFISSCPLLVPSDYKKSWEYIMRGSNSIRRGTNYNVLLNMLKWHNKRQSIDCLIYF